MNEINNNENKEKTIQYIDKEDLIRRIKYSEYWNTPIPKWVYGVIQNMTSTSLPIQKVTES